MKRRDLRAISDCPLCGRERYVAVPHNRSKWQVLICIGCGMRQPFIGNPTDVYKVQYVGKKYFFDLGECKVYKSYKQEDK